MGKPKQPDYTPPPLPSPAAIPQPSEISPQTAEKKRARVASMRWGMMSTMKTGGVAGKGPDLLSPEATGAKKTLGG